MAQLDSASDSDSDGWRFKSAWVYHSNPATLCCGVSFLSLPYRTILATATNSCLFSKSRYGIFIV